MCIRDSYRGKMLLAEANMWPEDVRPYFGEADECHMAFHFPLMPRMYMAIAQEDRHPLVEIMQQTPEIPDICQWAIFLRNHDELTLEMVTSRDRNAGFSRADPQRLYLPPIMDAIYGYEAVSVEAQQRDPTSLLSWTKRM